MSPAEHQLELHDGSTYRVKAGSIQVSEEFSTVSLSEFFGSERPVVLAQPQTDNEDDPIISWIKDVSNDSFDVRIQEAEAKSDGHLPETIGYIALEQKVGYLFGKPFEVQRTEEVVDEDWHHISFEQEYEAPRVCCRPTDV